MAFSNILSDYINKRKGGADSKLTLEMLRASISGLPEHERRELEKQIRVWEKERNRKKQTQTGETKRTTQSAPTVQAEPEARKTSLIKSLWRGGDSQRTIEIPQVEAESPAATKPVPKGARVKCPTCGKQNAAEESFCFSCGSLLESPQAATGTQKLSDHEAQDFAFHFYGKNSTLVLKPRTGDVEFKIRPQDTAKELVVGRIATNSPSIPDVDLSAVDAEQQGVSRQHLSIRYIPKDNALQVCDLGSANGSFINGQRLHPRETRLLRNGDDLRLGRLVLRANFMHD